MNGQRIKWNDFARVDLRIGTVIEVEPFPEAHKPAFKLRIDFGPLGVRRSSAQITDHYDLKALTGRQVVAVVNFPPKQIGPVRSEVLILGALEDSGVVLIGPDRAVENGARIG